MKKATEEAKLLTMYWSEVIKVVREEAKKLGINLKEATSTKAGETFKKAQDTKHEVLKREHSKKDDIHKVGLDSIVSYLVMVSMVKTKENARFSLKLRKMIDDHQDQDKLKSKKVKLEALGCHHSVRRFSMNEALAKEEGDGFSETCYVRDTCPDIHKPSEKLVDVMPINKKKTVRFAEPVISSSTSQKQLGSSQTQTTNNFVLTSIGVSWSTKSSTSKSTDNTKNDRILQISSSTLKKNKVEYHSRIVKSCLNKPNCVVEPSGNANVQHSKLNTNFELMCVEFVSDMNASSKSKSVKKAKKKEEWKPIGKVFTKIRYNWRPTGRTFTLVGNVCPLTKITATNKVPFREPIPLEVVQIVLWYLDSGCSKHMTGYRSQLTNFIHKFLGTVKFSNDQIAKIMGYGDYYVERLGHNLFSVGQFCDSNLE
ncbi:hypothetical protein Tco_0812872, partial [Tanacetum coccineum]